MERNLKGDEMMDTSSLELCINSFRHVDYSMMTREEETTARSDLYPHSPPGKETRQLDAEKLQEEGVICMQDQLKRIRLEQKKLTQMVMGVREGVDAMHTQLLKLLLMKNNNNNGEEAVSSRKRKSSLLESYDWSNNTIIRVIQDQDSLYQRPPAPLNNKQRSITVLVTADPSDISLIVKDGYHWRKYGQKVTRDNPGSPRAYYKCSFAPTCPVKKKVQRSGQDPSVLEATYQGQHNHHSPTQPTTCT